MEIEMAHKPYGPYERFFKRPMDFTFSLIALIVLLPLMLLLTVIGAVAMKGNPFFVQMRPGRIEKKLGKEKVFPLIKFRTMTDERDGNGQLLPDGQRLNGYGKFLRNTSLDELPELLNILKGDMAIVGPRPLVMQYIPYYTEYERHRHDVRPGLTGLAQIHGRNALVWEKRFEYDVRYANRITLCGDISILWKTVATVFQHKDIIVRGSKDSLEDFDVYRRNDKHVSA